jgi:hypothetical protein
LNEKVAAFNGRGNSLRYPQKLELTSPTSGGRWVGIVRLRTKTTEFSFLVGDGVQLGPLGTSATN